MKTINITDEEFDFLTKLSTRLKTQDNAWTQDPLYIVYDWQKVPTDSNYSDYSEWHEMDNYESFYDTEEECCEAMRENADDDDLELEEGEDYEQVFYLKKRIYVATFLTRKQAEVFIKLNEYHWSEPHIYVESMWRNYELQQLVDIVTNLTESEKPSHITKHFKDEQKNEN